jgi:tetratricopeptide (TPR) repeat protein
MATGLRTTTPVGLPRHMTFKKAIQGGVLAFVGLAVLAGGYMAMRNFGIGPVGTLVASGVLDEGGVVVLADFVDRTGDASLARTVTEAIRVDLSQSRAISLMSPNAVRDALERMRRSPDTVLTEGVAREIANREGLKAILTGEVSAAGGGYVLTANLLSAETGDILTAQRATASDSTDLIAAMDRLSVSLRERIGESLKTIRAREPLLWATTASLPALRRYTDGNLAVLSGDSERGIELLREAVALDTTFAEAYRKLAVELGNANISRREMLDAMTRAYRYRDRLPDATRYLVEGSYHNNVTGDQAAIVRAYETAVDVASAGSRGATSALNNLAVSYWQTRNYEKEREYALRAVESSPEDVLVRWNALIALVNLGQLDSAQAEFTVLDSMAPGHVWTQYSGSWLGFARKDWEQAKKYSTITAGSPADPFFFAQQRAYIEAVQGRLDAAGREYVGAERLALEAGLPDYALVAAAEQADLMSTVRGDTAGARRFLNDAMKRFPLDSIEAFDRPTARLAQAQINAGNIVEARRLLSALERDVPADLRSKVWLRARAEALAAMAVQEGRAGDAVATLNALPQEGFCEPCDFPPLIAALDAAGMRDSAIAVAERYATMVNGTRILADGLHLGPTLFRLGEMFEAKGDTAKAVEYYSQFTELWKDADPDLQVRVTEARNRIARLSLR